jgi:hypothetical protein
MLGEKPHLTPLESRKQLLLLESELNRALLLSEARQLKNELHQLSNQVRSLGSLVSSAAHLAGTFADIGQTFSARTGDEKPRASWMSALIDGAKAGASLWGAWRSRSK